MNGLRVSAFKVATKALTASAVPLLMPLALGFPAAWHVQTPPSWTQTRCTAPGCPRCCCCCCCRHSGWAQHRPLCIPQWHPGWAAAPVVFAASGKRAIGPPIRTRKRSVVEGKRGICERKKGEGRREKGGGVQRPLKRYEQRRVWQTAVLLLSPPSCRWGPAVCCTRHQGRRERGAASGS